jgi:glycerophosphoryl diester phosphodiesterase
MPYEGDYTQEDYAQQMIDEYKAAGVPPSKVWAQSFNLNDVLYWIENEPRFGKQAVFLDGRYGDPDFDYTNPETWDPSMEDLVNLGVNIIAPPMWMLLALDADDQIVPSTYANEAKWAGLDIITWTLERSGFLKDGGGFYYQSITDVINNDGDMLDVLDVLAMDVGVIGVFSDWPATVSYYANCMKLK